jgi:hypothetical protein
MTQAQLIRLTIIAALFPATGTAEADAQLPEAMLGEWCTADAINTKAQEVYFRPNHRESDRSHCSDFTEGIEMDKDGYGHEGLYQSSH